MNFICRPTQAEDADALFQLYQTVAQQGGGIARTFHEITQDYIQHNLDKTLANGVGWVIEYPNNPTQLIASVHCYQLVPMVFRHILSELTIVVHPHYQAMGVGRLVFSTLLNDVAENHKDILRIELITRESNEKAIRLYEKLGFRQEGRFEQRIWNTTGEFEADIPMAWTNPNFLQS